MIKDTLCFKINTWILKNSAVQLSKGELYPGNNGTVSGDTYCAGNWGGVGGQNKNMKCTDQFDAGTGEKLDCTKSYATHAGLRPTNVYCTK